MSLFVCFNVVYHQFGKQFWEIAIRRNDSWRFIIFQLFKLGECKCNAVCFPQAGCHLQKPATCGSQPALFLPVVCFVLRVRRLPAPRQLPAVDGGAQHKLLLARQGQQRHLPGTVRAQHRGHRARDAGGVPDLLWPPVRARCHRYECDDSKCVSWVLWAIAVRSPHRCWIQVWGTMARCTTERNTFCSSNFQCQGCTTPFHPHPPCRGFFVHGIQLIPITPSQGLMCGGPCGGMDVADHGDHNVQVYNTVKNYCRLLRFLYLA